MKDTIKKLIFVTFFGAAMLTMTMFSCKKDSQVLPTNPKHNNQSISHFTPPKVDNRNTYLKNFKKRMMESKSDETMGIEEAAWHLEAVLNYTYGNAGYLTTDIHSDTFFYRIPSNGGNITLNQLNDAFVVLSEEVEDAFNNSNLTDKSVLAIQPLFENEENDEYISVRTILTMRGLNPFDNMWFDSTDYWDELFIVMDGDTVAGGKCGPYVGDCPNSGAPLELTRKLNLRIPTYNCLDRGGYFTDIESGFLSLFSIDFDDLDFLYDPNSPCNYKLYCRFGDALNPDSRCIPPDEMNYYLSKGIELVNHYKPTGKVPMSAYYQSDEILGYKESNCFHELYLQYGIFHCNDIRTESE